MAKHDTTAPEKLLYSLISREAFGHRGPASRMKIRPWSSAHSETRFFVLR